MTPENGTVTVFSIFLALIINYGPPFLMLLLFTKKDNPEIIA